MNRVGHEETTFFIGPEVEHTPAFSKKTLFVVGWQDPAQVEQLARASKTPHVFLGANHSFDASQRTSYFDNSWNELITHLLDRGYWVTLDYQAHQHKDVLEMLSPGVWQSRLFVPLLGVRIPKIEESNPNLTVKIDDVDFAATNRGVWCMHFREVTDSNRFTDWGDYGTDEIVTPIVNAVPTPVLHIPVEKPIPLTPAPVTKLAPEFSEVKNDSSLGLDTDSPSQLKPENEESIEKGKMAPTVQEPISDTISQIYASTAETDTVKETVKKKVNKATK